MTDLEKAVLLDMLNRGVCTHHWVTRNFVMRLWDGALDRVRLMYPLQKGVAMVEIGRPVDQYGTIRGEYQTMCAKHFVDSIESYC